MRTWTQLDLTSRKSLSALLALAVGTPTSASDTNMVSELGPDEVAMLDNEGGKEDGELPSAPPSAEVEASAGGAHHQGQKFSALGALDESNSPAGSEALVTEEDVAPVNGQRQTGLDSRSDEEMREATEHSGEDHTILPLTGNTALDKIGLRTFSALIRRENGPTGKRMELEAKVPGLVYVDAHFSMYHYHQPSCHLKLMSLDFLNACYVWFLYSFSLFQKFSSLCRL